VSEFLRGNAVGCCKFFGRPFVKRFALCRSDRCPVLSVSNVGVLWPNGWTDHDETWHAGRPRPWPHCVRWGPICPPQMGIAPNLRPISVAAKWLHGSRCHSAWSYRPRPRRLCDRWRPSPLLKRGRSPLPNFRPISVVAKRLDASRCHLVLR